jgi:trehalose synthase
MSAERGPGFRRIEVPTGYTIPDYRRYLGLGEAVAALETAAREAVPRLAGRTVWMVNATAQGGGVAEMLPREVSLLRQVGVKVEWLVIEADDPAYFALTKRIHNLIHGAAVAPPSADERARFEAMGRRLADALRPRLARGDLLVVHDPQPLVAGALAAREAGVRSLWRCHIGLDRVTPETQAAWELLVPWARAYDRSVFSLPAYVPPALADHAVVSHPAIDPLSHKNRDLSVHKLAGILVEAGLVADGHPRQLAPFAAPALRLQADGAFAPGSPEDLGLLFRPVVVQISRWDRLKGFAPLLDGFVRLKAGPLGAAPAVAAARLVLAGPDPAGVQDDPEALAVLDEIAGRWRALPPERRADVAVLRLPMGSVKENALMVNALQRCATVVVQNSLAEGFGLTAAEAMWKGRATLVAPAAGLVAQVRDGVDGRIGRDAADPNAVAAVLGEMLTSPKSREVWGANARGRVATTFDILHEAARWLSLLAGLADEPAPEAPAVPR